VVRGVDLDDGRLIAATRVGFVGLGRMGGPMVRCLLRAGMPVVAYDIDPARTAEAEQGGAEVASGPADVAARSDISLTMVMNDRVLRDVVLSEDGILGAAAPGHLYCDLSTVSPHVSADIAAAAEPRGVAYLRAKIAGSIGLATEGQLTVFTSGRVEDADRAARVLSSFAREVRHVGEGEAAHYLKLAHSVIVPAYAALIGEAVTFATQGGVDYATVIEILEAGPLRSQQLSLKAPMLRDRAFADPPSDIDTAAKDLDLALSAAAGLGVTAPFASTARQLMTSCQAHGDGKLDIWSVIRAFETLAAVER
jgi:3-hydroxyisobutyrate dehydrogenase-like beta-hydroxyacid dehydrogenase